jgi:hypothetical protein
MLLREDVEGERPGAVGSASYQESQEKPGNFFQVSASESSQPPAESWGGGEAMGSGPAEVACPATAGSLFIVTIVV